MKKNREGQTYSMSERIQDEFIRQLLPSADGERSFNPGAALMNSTGGVQLMWQLCQPY